MHPPHSSRNASGSDPVDSTAGFSLLVKLQHHVLGEGRSKTPDILQNRAVEPGGANVVCNFSLFILTEVNELERQEGNVESLA